jgi:hemerythrin
MSNRIQFLTWKQEMSVSDQLLDSHHKNLFAIINDLFDKMRDNISPPEFRQIAEEVAQYSEQHFHAEEEAMRQCGFAGREHHHNVHRVPSASVRATFFSGWEGQRGGQALANAATVSR